MERLRRLWTQWQIGAFALFWFASSAILFMLFTVAIAMGLAVVAWLASSALGISGAPSPQPASDGTAFLLWSAIIWLPLSVGIILPDIARIFADRIREMDEARRKAELAPYLKKAKKAPPAGEADGAGGYVHRFKAQGSSG